MIYIVWRHSLDLSLWICNSACAHKYKRDQTDFFSWNCEHFYLWWLVRKLTMRYSALGLMLKLQNLYYACMVLGRCSYSLKIIITGIFYVITSPYAYTCNGQENKSTLIISPSPKHDDDHLSKLKRARHDIWYTLAYAKLNCFRHLNLLLFSNNIDNNEMCILKIFQKL